jgi:hypothetical protein
MWAQSKSSVYVNCTEQHSFNFLFVTIQYVAAYIPFSLGSLHVARTGSNVSANSDFFGKDEMLAIRSVMGVTAQT